MANEWTKVHEERSTGGAIVRVSRREGRRQYSIQIGKEWRDNDGSVNADRLSHNVPVYINGSTPDRSLFDALERAYAFIQTDAPTQPTGRSAPASNGHARNHPVQTAFDFGTPDAGPGAADRRGRDRGRGRDQRYSRYDDEGDED